ncbi:uncharacterized protein LOC107272621 isoform X2 [Cephus cinctus]|uniref:Uncharacterized protein LOC107272621 isoform X2 n=1 Tax=Cephus cinctus TaxID=211228 RepID=A0AAJ7CA11_CEPCN|nr:uncharacterized protein LOC107272621 isoform X2 [Cephus cinctus]
MGWALTGVGVAVAIVLVAGAALGLCRRYCAGWQWRSRNVWSICEEWRHRLSWLWAPREEKVGLVKAQHPTAQTVPGLYRQTGNTSQYLLHSESDLRLDAQGAFTRFEAVDRDLHPPLSGGSTIPPQPLRPAPQPRPTPRPRPSPLQAPSAVEYLRMQEAGPGPLTPPPQIRPPQVSRFSGPPGQGSSIFVFENEPHKVHGPSRYEGYSTKITPEAIQMTSYTRKPDHVVQDFQNGYEAQEGPDRTFGQFSSSHEDTQSVRYSVQGSLMSQNVIHGPGEIEQQPYGSYDIAQRSHNGSQQFRQVRSDCRNSSGTIGSFTNENSNTTQTIMESIYGSHSVSKMLQSNQKSSAGNVNQGTSNVQGIEMTPFRNLNDANSAYGVQSSPSKNQGLQRASQYTENVPESGIYEAKGDHAGIQNHEPNLYAGQGTMLGGQLRDARVPPPAPPDPSNSAQNVRKNGPTTGERIFNALRSVTSQSYIDASEFYNSVLTSAQQVQRFTFPPVTRYTGMDNENTGTNAKLEPGSVMENVADGRYLGRDSDSIGIDNARRSSDLYSPELNLEAHRTAQEVYNSLQDPPSSPLLLKDLSQEPHPYHMDPSFTRTSEDIFNSIEQRRKSMERLNGLRELVEMDVTEPASPLLSRRRSSQDLYAALEEVQMKRRLSQSLEDTYTGYTSNESGEMTPSSRRGSQGPEPEPPPDESTLKRAVSCESVCSDTSVVLGDLEETPIVGHVCVGLEHERWNGRGAEGEGDLSVSVLEARDLIAPDGGPAQDTFARVCLLPDRQTYVQTRLYRGTPSPSYQEKFVFPLDGGPVGRTLLVEVFSVEVTMGGGASLLGEASLKLGPAPRPPATTWLSLNGPPLPTPNLGELMFSLSYLPTAERLTLVVVKARNLRGSHPLPGDFFVKVYLLQQGKKMHKKKTSVKRGEKSPIFNEAIIFSVPAHALQTIQLRLTVAEATGEPGTGSKAYSVGHVIVGSSASGRSLAHWRQMLAVLRRPVAMWHPLRK